MSYDTWKSLPNYVCMTTKRGLVRGVCKFTLTTGGAVDTTSAPGADFTLTKDGTTGKYLLTFPPCIDASIFVSLYSPAATVNTCVITAQDSGAGTATLLLASGDTAAYGASGDIIRVTIDAETES